MMKQKVLFLCTHNSARSIMAEAILDHTYGDRYEALSAGTEPSSVQPFALKVLSELGIDTSNLSSKSLDPFIQEEMDMVITLCDSTNEACPYFPYAKERLHKSFKDPSRLTGTSEEVLRGYRETRDRIKAWIDETFAR